MFWTDIVVVVIGRYWNVRGMSGMQMRVLAVPDESSSRTVWFIHFRKWEFWPYPMRVLAVLYDSLFSEMRVLAVPDERSSRTGMKMRILAVHDESSSRTIDYYAVDHFYTSLFRFIVGFDPRLPSHSNSIKLYRSTTVVRQIDLLTASVSWIITQLLWRPSVRPSVCPCRSRHHTM